MFSSLIFSSGLDSGLVYEEDNKDENHDDDDVLFKLIYSPWLTVKQRDRENFPEELLMWW